MMNAKEFAENYKIFECVAGSQAYEINTPESDIDIRGVFLPPLIELINPFNAIKQVNEKNQDEQFYSFPKFFHLLVDQNPNIIELLWMPDSKIIFKAPVWDELRLFKNDLISKKSYWKFAHYAHSQLKRIKGHDKWITKENIGKHELLKLFNDKKINIDFIKTYFHESIYHKLFSPWQLLLPENDDLLYSSINDIKNTDIRLISNNKPCQYHYIKLVDRNSGETIDISDTEKYSLNFFNLFGAKKINDEFYILYENGVGIFDKIGNFRSNLSGEFDKSIPKYFMSFASQQYKQDCESWKNYWEWRNNRNPKRAELEYKYNFDCKHAAHLIRLLYVGLYILKDQQVHVILPEKEKQIVKDIRAGKYSYEEVIQMADNLNWMNEEELKISKLRDNVDIELSKNLYYNLVCNALHIKQ